MSSKDIAISSREISAQVVQDGVKTAYIGVPGPPGPPGEKIVEWRSAWGVFEGEYQAGAPYEEGSIVTYQAAAGAGYGTYLASQGVPAGITPIGHPLSASHWDVLASPGAQGAAATEIRTTQWKYPFNYRGNVNLQWVAGATYVGPGSSGAEGDPDAISGRADVVRYDGALWVCRLTHKATNANRPGQTSGGITYWGKLIEEVKLTAVSAESVAWNADAEARLTGTHPNRGIAFKIPRGKDGDDGRDYNPATDFPYTAEQLKGAPGADALSWAAFHFEGNGTLRMVIPEECSILLGNNSDGDPHVVTDGAGSHQVSRNGSVITATTQLSRGDRIAVVATGVTGDYLVSIPFQG